MTEYDPTSPAATIENVYRERAKFADHHERANFADLRGPRRAPIDESEFEAIKIKQDAGPRIDARAKLIASTEFEPINNPGMTMRLEVYETKGGSYIAVSESEKPDSYRPIKTIATVIHPQRDLDAMRFAVMDFFNWADRARSMLRKAGWKFVVRVD